MLYVGNKKPFQMYGLSLCFPKQSIISDTPCVRSVGHSLYLMGSKFVQNRRRDDGFSLWHPRKKEIDSWWIVRWFQFRRKYTFSYDDKKENGICAGGERTLFNLICFLLHLPPAVFVLKYFPSRSEWRRRIFPDLDVTRHTRCIVIVAHPVLQSSSVGSLLFITRRYVFVAVCPCPTFETSEKKSVRT